MRNWEVIWESARKMVCIVPIKSDTPSLDTVLAFWSAEEADYLEYFVTEAQKRNIYTPYDLTELEHDEYEEKWNGFCDAYFAQGDE